MLPICYPIASVSLLPWWPFVYRKNRPTITWRSATREWVSACHRSAHSFSLINAFWRNFFLGHICRGAGGNHIDSRHMDSDDVPILFCIESNAVSGIWHRCGHNDNCLADRHCHKYFVSITIVGAVEPDTWASKALRTRVHACVPSHMFAVSHFWFCVVYFTHSMAIILHGEGLCWLPHTHTHGHGHNCSPQKHEHHSYHNNNKTKSEYKLLINEPMTVGRTKNVLLNGSNGTLQPPSARTNRSNSIYSYRSPNRSRTNSFSQNVEPTNGEILRRNSHATTINSIGSGGGGDTNQRDSCINLILNDDKLPANHQDTRICIFDGSSICPVHNYVHRDSSENTPASSDTEELHHRGHAHHHDHGHDFASKNINIQAAVIHVLGDFIQSIGVFVSAVIIKYYVSVDSRRLIFPKLITFM